MQLDLHIVLHSLWKRRTANALGPGDARMQIFSTLRTLVLSAQQPAETDVSLARLMSAAAVFSFAIPFDRARGV